MSLGERENNDIRMQNEIIQNVADLSHLLTSLATFPVPGNQPARVFIYYPEKRLTATQLLCDLSFRAIMDKYDC